MKQLIYCAAIAAGALSVATTAHAGFRDGSRMFDRMDANGDGVITQDELKTHREAAFKRLDADSDGLVSTEEQQAARDRSQRMHDRMQGHQGALTDALDTDDDGAISSDEFMAAPYPMAEGADDNDDGSITKDEFTSFFAKMKAKRD